MNKKKIIINLTEDWFFVSHFLGRAVDATKSGYEVYISCNETSKRKIIENNNIKFLPSGKMKDSIPFQRKTPLKWNSDGSLSSVDMARILSRLEKTNLTECELSCEWGTTSNIET